MWIMFCIIFDMQACMVYNTYSVIYCSENMELIFEGKTFFLTPIYLEAQTEQKFTNYCRCCYLYKMKKINSDGL